MKKFILPILVVLISAPFFSPVLAKNPQDIKLNCPNISSTLRFVGEGKTEVGSDLAYSVCKSEMGGVKVANTVVYLGGDIHIGLPENLPEELSDPSISDQTRLSPAKTEDLLVGDAGKIYFWGPPWEQRSSGDPYAQYKAKLGNCYLTLWGSVQNDLDIYLKTGVMPDWQTPADFMVGKLSAAAKEIEGKIAEECGAKNVIDNPGDKNGQPAGLSADPVQAINDWIMENDLISDPARLERMEREKLDLELYGRTPEMTAAIIKKAQEEWEASFSKPVSENITVVGGGGQLETPEEKTVVEGDFLPNGSTVSGDWLWTRLDIEFTEKVSAVLSFDNFHAEINSDSINLQRGEVEFKSLGDIKTHPVFTVKTPNAEIITKDTHFWVSFDKNKQSTTVGVYEGQVNVITKDGKTTTVTPNGNKPGVVVVSQKLSTTKLVLVGVVLAAVIGGVVLILKKRVFSRNLSKKKK